MISCPQPLSASPRVTWPRPARLARDQHVVRGAERAEVAVVVGATTVQRHDVVNLKSPVVWAFEHTLVAVTVEDASGLLLPFLAAPLSFGAVSEGARVAARARRQQGVAVEASCAH